MVEPPAPNPCGSCPYRQDVPSGIWDRNEYEKLPAYDRPTPEQPMGVFLCHQQDGRACAGWVAVHEMGHCLALRMACSTGSVEDPEPFFNYTTDTPLWDSGAAAAEHGMAEIAEPDERAQHMMDRLTEKQERRGQ